jgi:hypothetical protein
MRTTETADKSRSRPCDERAGTDRITVWRRARNLARFCRIFHENASDSVTTCLRQLIFPETNCTTKQLADGEHRARATHGVRLRFAVDAGQFYTCLWCCQHRRRDNRVPGSEQSWRGLANRRSEARNEARKARRSALWYPGHDERGYFCSTEGPSTSTISLDPVFLRSLRGERNALVSWSRRARVFLQYSTQRLLVVSSIITSVNTKCSFELSVRGLHATIVEKRDVSAGDLQTA